MRTSRVTRMVTTVAAVSAFTVPIGAARAGVTCSAHDPIYDHPVVGADGATEATNTGVDGVRGTLQVPDWNSANLRGQSDTVADVQMLIEDSAHHYFQLGWYISAGGTGGLLATSTPKPFFVEGTANDTTGVTEFLTTLQVPLAPGYHTFELLHVTSSDPLFNHKYVARIDTSQVWTSTMAAAIEGTPSVVGETNWQCADMFEWSASPAYGPSLYGHHVNASWSLWQQHLDVKLNAAQANGSCWTVGRVQNQTATSYGWDVC